MVLGSGDVLNMEKLLGELRTSYRGIDLRVVLAKRDKASEKDDWTAVFLKIVFTSKERHEVECQQKEAQAPFGDLDGENLKVKMIYFDISEAQNVIDCISIGRVDVLGYSAHIDGEFSGIKDREVANSDSRYSQDRCKMAWSRMLRGSVVQYLENLVGKKNVDLEWISELLGVENLQNTIDNNVIVLFPLYSKKLEVEGCEKGRLLCKYDIDRNLVEKCDVKITISRKDQKQYKSRRELRTYVDQYQDHMVRVTIPIPSGLLLSPHDYISVELLHRVIGEIRYVDRFYGSEIINRPYYKDPFTESFRHFIAGEKFQDYLLHPMSIERKQVAGVSWLLAMTGFNVIPLNMVSPDDEKIKTNQPNPSCDILASVNGNPQVLLAIDCTTSVPKMEKISKILVTMEFLTSKLKNIAPLGWENQVIPVIIASVDASIIKPLATLHNVRLVDINDLEVLYKLVMEKGLKNDAIRLLDSIVGVTRT